MQIEQSKYLIEKWSAYTKHTTDTTSKISPWLQIAYNLVGEIHKQTAGTTTTNTDDTACVSLVHLSEHQKRLYEVWHLRWALKCKQNSDKQKWGRQEGAT